MTTETDRLMRQVWSLWWCYVAVVLFAWALLPWRLGWRGVPICLWLTLWCAWARGMPWAVLKVRQLTRSPEPPYRETTPEPDDGRPDYETQHAMLDRIIAAGDDGSMTSDQVADALLAMGPIRGSYGDYRGSRCHHLVSYPGCRGGCNPR